MKLIDEIKRQFHFFYAYFRVILGFIISEVKKKEVQAIEYKNISTLWKYKGKFVNCVV